MMTEYSDKLPVKGKDQHPRQNVCIFIEVTHIHLNVKYVSSSHRARAVNSAVSSIQ